MKTALGNIATYASVILWSAVWAMAMQCKDVPLLLLAGSIAIVWGGIAAVEELINGGRLSLSHVSARDCVFDAFGGNAFRLAVIPAVWMIDPVEAANLSNVWLGAAIVLALWMGGGQLGPRQQAGILCFIAGMAVTAYDGVGPGHVLALCGGLVWGWYVARSGFRAVSGRQAEAVGNLAFGALLIYLSLLVEAPWNIGPADVYWLCGLIFAENVGYVLWLYGARHGDVRKAKVGVLFMPVAAVVWIYALGRYAPSGAHLAATLAVTLAGLILSPHVFRPAKTARVV